MGGRLFTWINKAGTKLSKLDRFLMTGDVLTSHQDLKTKVLDRQWSDHNPILLYLEKTDYCPIPFKLFHSWMQRKGFDDMIKQANEEFANSSFPSSLQQKLKFMKLKIKEWHNESKSKDLKCLVEIQTLLNVIEEDLDRYSYMDIAQKSKIQWDIEGDENTNFFHGILNQKRRHQLVQGIMVDGEWISNPIQPASSKEIRKAVWDCGSGVMPRGSNSAFITLIPKVPNPLLIKDYRSISLISMQYKILAKLLANRLAIVLDSIVSPVQSAFKYGRQILDGPLMVSEIIDCYKKRSKNLMIFKVDLEKAFDSARTSVLVNGIPTPEFSLGRGLRQEDPLSSLLFILIMEGLHLTLNAATRSQNIRGVTVGETKFSHFFFTDDVVILTE
ncbi:putative RNA-directed DNA polymerase, eukaryota, reverse transcriptase zinc-binding domain protein [Tanacetum coccineum]